MKVLVTGGAGFIGSNFIQYILRQYPGWHITNLDKLTYAGNPENLATVEKEPRYCFVGGDIADAALVDRLLAGGFDAVVNFAAESHVDRSILDASPFVETNVKGAQVLLEAACKHNSAKFIQVSTDEVYGSLGPDEPPFTEESPLAPNSPYAASKAAADLFCRAYYQTRGLPVVITRCSNNFGPYQFPEKFIPTIITGALQDKPVPVYGDGLNVRDWLYVEDHCDALAMALLHGIPGEVYNIGGGRELSNIELVKTILALLGKPESLIKMVRDRPGHDRRYAIDPSKIRDRLGWQAKRSFTEALAKTVHWYRDSLWWKKAISSPAYAEHHRRWYKDR